MARERTLKVNIVGDTKSLNAALGHSSTRLSKLGKVAGVAGGAVGAGLGFAVKSAMGFEKQLSSLGAVSNATAKQMEQFRKQALKAGADTAFSAKEAAVAQTELAKGGLSVANIMGGGLNSALALAAAGELELGEAAATTANAMNLFGLRGSESIKVADALATAANATTADVSDFGMALKAGGAVAKSAGFSFQETVVALEALAASGVKNSDAGTSLKAALIQLIKPTDKQAEMAKKMGLSFIDAEGNMKSLGAISAMLRDKLGGQTAAQRTATLATIAGTDGVRTLTALYDAGPAKLDKWRKGVDESGTAAEVAKKKQDNLAGAVEQLAGSAETLGIVVGTALIPAITDATQWLTQFINQMQDGTGTGGQFVRIMESVGSAIYDVGKFVVDSRREIVSLVAAFATYKTLMLFAAGLGAVRSGALGLMIVSKLVPAFWALNAALTANPIGLVVVGLAALAGGLVYAYTKSKTFREVVAGAFTVVREIAVTAFDVITFGLRQFLVGIGKVAGVAAKLPGMGWLKGVSKAALGAAAKLRGVSDTIRGIPDKKEFSMTVRVRSSREIADAAANIIESGRNAPARRGAGLASGGIIPGQGNQDTVPAMLTPGEFVIRKRVVEKFGPTFFAAINDGKGPQKFTSGGIVARANKLDGMRIPYLYGGGHGTRDGFNKSGMDCSASVSYALGISPRVSGALMSFGRPGPGSRNDTKIYANPGHVFAVFNGRGWGTSRENPGGGPGWLSYNHRPGFTIRHLEDGGQKGQAASSTGDPQESVESGKATKSEREQRSGSRLVNSIAAPFAKGIAAATRQARNIGGVIEQAEGGYVRSERFFGQVIGGQSGVFGEEDLSTVEGRSQRSDEVRELKKLKVQQLARMDKRKMALKRAISRSETQLEALSKARDKATGPKRVSMNKRMKAFEQRLFDLKGDLAALGESISDVQLDIGDLDKDLGELAQAPEAEPGPSTTDKLSQALGDIDLQERAGVLSPEQARAARIATLTAAQGGAFGALTQREMWDVMGQLREATDAQTQAIVDNTSALRDVQAGLAAQLAYADRVMAITSSEAVRFMVDRVSDEMGQRTHARGALPGSGILSRL